MRLAELLGCRVCYGGEVGLVGDGYAVTEAERALALRIPRTSSVL